MPAIRPERQCFCLASHDDPSESFQHLQVYRDVAYLAAKIQRRQIS
jgi:hypothetical protein